MKNRNGLAGWQLEQTSIVSYFNGTNFLISNYIVLNIEQISCYNIFDLKLDASSQEYLDIGKKNAFDNCQVLHADAPDYVARLGLSDLENARMLLYSCIQSEKDTDVILNISVAGICKIWLNGKIIMIFPRGGRRYVTVKLQVGENDLLYEFYSPTSSSSISVQISDYQTANGDSETALAGCSSMLSYSKTVCITEDTYCPKQSSFRFLCMPLNSSSNEYMDQYTVELKVKETDYEEYFSAYLNRPVQLDLARLRKIASENPYSTVFVVCQCERYDGGEPYRAAFEIYLNDLSDASEKLHLEIAKVYSNMPEMVKLLFDGIEKSRKKYYRANDSLNMCRTVVSTYRHFQNYLAGSLTADFYKTSGIHTFYIRSQIDDSLVQMKANVPEDYDESRKYPLLISISIGTVGYFTSWVSQSALDEPCICIDCSVRGMTLGSYIGEASFFEIFEFIKDQYSVDGDRVYLVGHSNGGYAVYAIVQNYPHLPAAIYPLIGYPNLDTVKNISNIPAFQIVSLDDHVFTGREHEVEQILEPYGNYTQYDTVGMTHTQMSAYAANARILNQLLKKRRNLWPEHIEFKTIRNRHLKSFWITLHGISFGEREAFVQADWENAPDSLITIEIRGSRWVAVTIPPQIDRKCFTVRINGYELRFKDYQQTELILAEDNGIWKMIEQSPEVDLRKGSGILDVYMDSLRIVIPSETNETVKQVVSVLAHPKSNGIDPNIDVDYPIYDPFTVPDDIFEHNIILLDFRSSNLCIGEFSANFTFHCDDTGFEYQGKRYDGEYVVMEAVKSTKNGKRTVLAISANCQQMLKRHLFLRKMIISSYMSGFHPYLNQTALILLNGEYFGVYERGGELFQLS